MESSLNKNEDVGDKELNFLILVEVSQINVENHVNVAA